MIHPERPSCGFEQVRHRPALSPSRPRELIVVCAAMKSNVNLSQIVRSAGCFGIPRVIGCGASRLDARIAREGARTVQLEVHRSLGPVLNRLRTEGYQLVGLEQAKRSESLFEFEFVVKSALIVGNERLGIEPELLKLVDRVAEIPMYGLPHSLNAATSAALGIYEYCRQFP